MADYQTALTFVPAMILICISGVVLAKEPTSMLGYVMFTVLTVLAIAACLFSDPSFLDINPSWPLLILAILIPLCFHWSARTYFRRNDPDYGKLSWSKSWFWGHIILFTGCLTAFLLFLF